MNNLTLVPLERQHTPLLWRACWPERELTDIEELLAGALSGQERHHVWPRVALMDGEVVGFGMLARWGKKAEISDVVVRADLRGQGIGTALIREMLAIAQAQGFPFIEIGAAESNPRALALYERLGFVEERRVVVINIGAGAEPVIYLSLRLAPQAAR